MWYCAEQRAELFVYWDPDRSLPAVVPSTSGCRLARRPSVPWVLWSIIICSRHAVVDYFRFLAQIYSDVPPAVCAHTVTGVGEGVDRGPVRRFYCPPATDGMFFMPPPPTRTLYAKTPLLYIAPRTRFTGFAASCRTKQNNINVIHYDDCATTGFWRTDKIIYWAKII